MKLKNKFSYSHTLDLSRILKRFEDNTFLIEPDSKLGVTDLFCMDLFDSLIKGYPLGDILFEKYNYQDTIIDGRKRLTAIRELFATYRFVFASTKEGTLPICVASDCIGEIPYVEKWTHVRSLLDPPTKDDSDIVYEMKFWLRGGPTLSFIEVCGDDYDITKIQLRANRRYY